MCVCVCTLCTNKCGGGVEGCLYYTLSPPPGVRLIVLRDEHERTPLELASNYMGNGVQEILTTMQATSRKRALERLKTSL